MIIKKDGDDIRTGLFVKNDFEPVSIGKISSYKTQESSGQELELLNTYNDSYDGLKVFGKSEQKAQWNQAEGVTTQVVTVQGNNLFDGVFESGFYDESGSVASTNYIRCANYIPVQPNTLYYFLNNKDDDTFLWYDAEKNFISQVNDLSAPSPANARYLRFFFYGTDLSTEYMICGGSKPTVYEPFVPDSPSPSYPSDFISNTPAGSYQLQTQNGIYEVTLTEDLRGIDDTYRDKICFDSVSGTGYLEQNTQKVNMQDKNISNYSGTDDETLHFGMAYDFDKAKVSNNQFICTHFPFVNGVFYNPTEDSMVIYKNTDTTNSLFVNIRKEHLDITDFSDLSENVSSFQRWISANSPTVILPMTTPIKTALTFTKVTSSTLPVLPWTAYGKNLWITDAAYPIRDVLLYDKDTQIYTIKTYASESMGGVSQSIYHLPVPIPAGTEITAVMELLCGKITGSISFGGYYKDGTAKALEGYLELPRNVDLSGKTIKSTVTTDHEVTDFWAFLYGFSGVEEEVKFRIQYQYGSEYRGWEPFNPTPPESLTPSPDYPHQIYDLSDVTVTSMGRNLWKAGDITLTNYENSVTNYLDISALEPGKTYFWICNVEVISGDISTAIPGQLRLLGSDNTKRIIWNPNESKEIPNDWDLTRNTFNLYGAFGEGEKLVNITNAMFVEGTEIPPFCDKYRSTSITIPLLRAIPDGRGGWAAQDELRSVPGMPGWYDVVRNVELYTITGDDKFYLSGTNDGNLSRVYFSLQSTNKMISGTGLPGMCTHLTLNPKWSGNEKEGVRFGQNNNAIYFYFYKEYKEIIAFFKERYESGDPVVIQYILANPIIERVYLGDLKTAPYYTKLFADKETGGLEATYKRFENYEDLFPSPTPLTLKRISGSDGKDIITSDGSSLIVQ